MIRIPRVGRGHGAAAVFGIVLAAAALALQPHGAAADGPYASPCDSTPSLPFCLDAMGPVVDVTATWRAYQPALVQPVPISDYQADPEDSPPPLGVGVCGGETSAPAADGTPIPPSTQQAQPPAGVPAPPGTSGPYCVLRYIADDFTPLCASCHRLLIDYSAIPAPGGSGTPPPADGHWAGRLQWSQGYQLTAVVNGHSPNIKNLCADKFVNEAPGATCSATTSGIDQHAIEVESDSSTYHHFPFEGRYYNGPAYLAGDGVSVPYHWVRGAFVDVDTSASGIDGTVWYQLGYRGLGDAAPDTDQSYGCLCEVPPVGHSAFSPGYRLAPVAAAAAASAGGAAPASGGVRAATVGSLPLTAGASAGLASAAGAVGLPMIRLARRRRRRA